MPRPWPSGALGGGAARGRALGEAVGLAAGRERAPDGRRRLRGAARPGGGRRPPRGPGTTRAQVTLFALIAVSLAVLVVVVLQLSRGRAERSAQAAATAGQGQVDGSRELALVVDSALRDAVEGSVYEVGRHGGYTLETLPGPVIQQRPVYLRGGSVLLFPTVKVMEDVVGREATRRLAAKLAAVREERNGTVAFGAPKVAVSLHDEGVTATLDLTYSLAGEVATARSLERTAVTLDLRLRTLWSRAKSYLDAYARERTMERGLLQSVINDARIPSPPGGVGETMACERRKVAATKQGLSGPFAENARLAVARELARVRAAAKDEKDVDWSMELVTSRVNMTLLANPGSDRESDTAIEHLSVPFPFIDVRKSEPVCLGRYNVSYTVTFPVVVTVRDLRPIAQGVRAEGRSLELAFVVEPYLAGIDPFARLGSALPPSVEDLCSPAGGCELELEATGPGGVPVDGRAWLDACPYDFTSGRLSRTKVPCGPHTLIVESSSPPGLGSRVEQVTVDRLLSRRVELGARSRVRGRVYVRDRTWCSSSQRVREGAERPLEYIEGVPPRAVRLHLVPLAPTQGPALSVMADGKARFEFPEVDAGTYLLVATPSTDPSGRPAYKVDAEGKVLSVASGDVEVALELAPLIPVHTLSGYEYVTAIEEC